MLCTVMEGRYFLIVGVGLLTWGWGVAEIKNVRSLEADIWSIKTSAKTEMRSDRHCRPFRKADADTRSSTKPIGFALVIFPSGPRKLHQSADSSSPSAPNLILIYI